MPARPAKVSGRAPAASASRLISARPRATSAAFALSPSRRPSAPPAASAITFFAAAQSSTPDHVVAHVDAKDRRVRRHLERTASSRSSLATTAAAGSPRTISSAMFGPESTATGRPRTSVESRSPVAGSRPFERLSTGAVPGSPETTSPNTRAGYRHDHELGVGVRRVRRAWRSPIPVRSASGDVARVAARRRGSPRPARGHARRA